MSIELIGGWTSRTCVRRTRSPVLGSTRHSTREDTHPKIECFKKTRRVTPRLRFKTRGVDPVGAARVDTKTWIQDSRCRPCVSSPGRHQDSHSRLVVSTLWVQAGSTPRLGFKTGGVDPVGPARVDTKTWIQDSRCRPGGSRQGRHQGSDSILVVSTRWVQAGSTPRLRFKTRDVDPVDPGRVDT